MAIVSGDIKFYLTGAGSDGGAQANSNASLGRYRSSTEIVDSSLHNLFDEVNGTESQAGDTEYRCICVKNTNILDTWEAVKVWLATATGNSQDVVSFALEVPTGGDQTGSAQVIGNETTTPNTGAGNVGNWSTATSETNAETVEINAHDANLDAEEILFIWIRRTIAAGASAQSGDGVTLRVKGQSQ